ncbi:hypothetical protein E4T39_00084 [Aureobasidium subglaciale]|nr:hypothetical protein E4T39_00084 [Aureobasidium subglaciale]
MPKGKRPTRAAWLFRDKPAVASANNAFGRFSVSIKYDEIKAEGSVIIQHVVHLEGFQSEQTLDLVLRPESIVACDLLLDSHKLSPEVLNLIPTNRSEILSLSLTMHTPGTVICPTAPLPLSFISTSFGQQFAAFSRLCQATNLQLYLGKDQFQTEHLIRLERFTSAITHRKLRANPIDLRSLGGGGGKQETTWDNIHLPLRKDEQTEPGATRKRCRSDSGSPQLQSGEPYTKIQRFLWGVPPGSPTEMNTPSSRHTPFSPTTDQSTSHGHSEEQRSGSRARTPLPAYPTGSDNMHTPSQKASISPWGSSVDIKPTFLPPRAPEWSAPSPAVAPELTKALSGILQQLLPQVIEGAFSSILGPLIDARLEALVNHKMEALVRERLPQLTHNALQQNMNRFIDELQDGHKRAEIEIGETVEEAKIELNDTRDQGIDEIETWAQGRLGDFEDEVDLVTVAAVESLENKTNALKERLDRKFRGQCRELRKVIIDTNLEAAPASTIFTALAAVLPAFALPIARFTGSSFSGLAIHSGSSIHLSSSINANGKRLLDKQANILLLPQRHRLFLP